LSNEQGKQQTMRMAAAKANLESDADPQGTNPCNEAGSQMNQL
jgi:hypothetical protein